MIFPNRSGPGRRGRSLHEHRRRQMIAETSAFLTWALRHGKSYPRIPRRAVKEGGFRALLNRPGARAAAEHWWHRVLDEFGA